MNKINIEKVDKFINDIYEKKISIDDIKGRWNELKKKLTENMKKPNMFLIFSSSIIRSSKKLGYDFELNDELIEIKKKYDNSSTNKKKLISKLWKEVSNETKKLYEDKYSSVNVKNNYSISKKENKKFSDIEKKPKTGFYYWRDIYMKKHSKDFENLKQKEKNKELRKIFNKKSKDEIKEIKVRQKKLIKEWNLKKEKWENEEGEEEEEFIIINENEPEGELDLREEKVNSSKIEKDVRGVPIITSSIELDLISNQKGTNTNKEVKKNNNNVTNKEKKKSWKEKLKLKKENNYIISCIKFDIDEYDSDIESERKEYEEFRERIYKYMNKNYEEILKEIFIDGNYDKRYDENKKKIIDDIQWDNVVANINGRDSIKLMKNIKKDKKWINKLMINYLLSIKDYY